MIDSETVRRLALSFPEAAEQDHFGRPSFRVRGKIFATLWPNERRAMVKLCLADQAALVALDPAVFSSVPGAWGQQGATFVALDNVEADMLEDALQSAWQRVAPRRLVAAYGEAGREPAS